MSAVQWTPCSMTHIYLDETGRAWIDDTNVKVIEVVLEKVANAWSPVAIHIQHPDLSLAQIHAALTYYYDHQAEFDVEIERQRRAVAEQKAPARESPLRQRLRQTGLRP